MSMDALDVDEKELSLLQSVIAQYSGLSATNHVPPAPALPLPSNVVDVLDNMDESHMVEDTHFAQLQEAVAAQAIAVSELAHNSAPQPILLEPAISAAHPVDSLPHAHTFTPVPVSTLSTMAAATAEAALEDAAAVMGAGLPSLAELRQLREANAGYRQVIAPVFAYA